MVYTGCSPGPGGSQGFEPAFFTKFLAIAQPVGGHRERPPSAHVRPFV
jgi:hypothetical protein